MMRPAAATRGFTLLELLVGITVALLVFSATMEVMVFMNGQRRIAQGRAELNRDAAVAVGWLRRDFGGTKAGDATNQMISGNASAVAGTLLDPTVRGFASSTVVGNKEFALLTEVPRPDTNLDGFFTTTAQRPQPDSRPWTTIPVTSELSGRVTQAGVARDSTSLIPTSACLSGSEVGCPWALRKVRVGDIIQVIAPNNFWQNETITTLEASSANLDPSGFHAIGITPGFERSPNTPFVAGRIVQMDRIGYRLRQITSGPMAPGVLERRHCWGGALDPTSGSFTDFTNTPTNCTGVETGWQIIARNLDVDSTSTSTARSYFRYFGSTGAELAPPIGPTVGIFSVEADLRFKKTAHVGKFNAAANTGSKRALNLNLNERVIIRR